MHTVKTTIVTTATGEISGYGFCVEAEHGGEPAEISACITASLDMLRQTIAASFDPPAPEPNPMGETEGDEPPARAAAPAPAATITPSTRPPATPEEARQRFYTRYGEIIGGETWASVRGYLRQPRRPEPATVEQWIATAEAVRDRSRAQEQPRRSYARS